MATPMFVFMFGFMIEFVYVRRSEGIGLDSVYKRILIRSFQCYVAYALISFCAVLGGYKSIENFFSSLLFFSNSRFGNILRAYSVMLLITPFIIKLRIRFGVKFVFCSLMLLVISYSFIHELKSVDFGIINHPFNVLLGIGLHRGGPSVYGALSFYLVGMIMASSLSKCRSKIGYDFSYFYLVSFALIVTFLIFGSVLINEGFKEGLVLFADYTYRYNNAPAYYIIGTFGSLLTITLFSFLFGTRIPPIPIKFILPIGTSSLISYTAGNVILNLFGRMANIMNQFVFIALFFLAVVLITRNIRKLPYFNYIYNFMNFRHNKAFQQTNR